MESRHKELKHPNTLCQRKETLRAPIFLALLGTKLIAAKAAKSNKPDTENTRNIIYTDALYDYLGFAINNNDLGIEALFNVAEKAMNSFNSDKQWQGWELMKLGRLHVSGDQTKVRSTELYVHALLAGNKSIRKSAQRMLSCYTGTEKDRDDLIFRIEAYKPRFLSKARKRKAPVIGQLLSL